MAHLSRIFFFFLVGLQTLLASAQERCFYYDNPEDATGIHISMRGVAAKTQIPWQSRNMTRADAETAIGLYCEPLVMAHFGAGHVITEARAKARLEFWEERASIGLPVGGWIIETPRASLEDASVAYGLMAAGIPGDEGVCELSRMILPTHQKKSLGGSMMNALVNVWAPQVRWHGLNDENPKVREKFCCFGKSALRQLYVSASPANEASWRSQLSAGFCPKALGPDAKILPLDVSDFRTYAQIEEALAARFASAINPLDHNKLFSFEGLEHRLHTVSYVSKYTRVKFHMTQDVGDL